jgi:hypothetical protein
LALIECIQFSLQYFLSHPIFLFLFIPLLIFWLITEQFPHWEVNNFINKIEFFIQYITWWVGLGILSSLGLGSGFQSGILFLFPHIVKISIAANTCKTTHFEYMTDMWMRSPPNLFKCPTNISQANNNSSVSFIDIWKLILPPCFLQAVGTAIGEIPPFLVTRAARLSAIQAGEDIVGFLPEELESTSKYRFINAAKAGLVSFLQRYGFLGVLLMSSWPNIAFDLCGICCGHFLMQFRVFFIATFIGKALIRNTYQTLIYVALCDEFYMNKIIQTLQHLTPDWLNLDTLIREAISDLQRAFTTSNSSSSSSSDSSSSIGANTTNTFTTLWNIMMATFLTLFLLSCIQQFAQYYQVFFI